MEQLRKQVAIDTVRIDHIDKSLEKVDIRLSSIEKLVGIGIGILAVINFLGLGGLIMLLKK